MAKFRKKPVVVDAEAYRPGMEDGFAYRTTDGGVAYVWDGMGNLVKPTQAGAELVPVIKTLEGYVTVSPGDYILTGVVGERYPCKPEIFRLTYELVE